MTARTCAAVAVVGALLAGCGYKGPLTLPEDTGPVVIRPAPQAQAGAPATVPQPVESSTPASQQPPAQPQATTPPAPQATTPESTAPQATTPQSTTPQSKKPPAPEGTPPGG